MNRLVMVGAGIAVCAVATLAPSDAQSAPKPVRGGITQTFRAVQMVAKVATVAPVKHTDYFFSGDPSDVATPAGRTKPTFSTVKPQGTNPAIQLGIPVASSFDGAPGAIYWRAPLTAKIAGPLELNWWWATEDPLAAGFQNADVTLIADPGTKAQKTIGATTVSIGSLGPNPTKLTSTLYVKGRVAHELAITVEPTYIDASEDLRVYYGSSDYPSGFKLPLGVTPPHAVPSTIGLPDRSPLSTVSSYVGRKAAEPTIGVTRSGNAFITAADFDGLSPATPHTKIYATYNGNRSWVDVSPTVPAAGSFPPTTLDPYLYVDQATGRIFSDDLTVACSVLQWSDDQGKTWTRGNPLACDGPGDDHQTVVTGPPPQGLSTNGYPNVVYYCVNKVAGSECARSLDGGNTFQASGAPAFTGVDPTNSGSDFCGGLNGHVVADRTGRIFLPKGHCGKPWLAVSDDGGQTWTRTLVSKTVGAAGIQTSVAIDSSGVVYYVWWDNVDHLPYLAVSKDAGKTFGPALLIAPPGVKEVNFPSITAGKRGQIAISFPGTKSSETAIAARPWNYYVLTSSDATSALPTFRSATANPVSDPIHRGICQARCAGMYDFLDVQIALNGDVWAVGVDTCTGRCAAAQGPKLGKSEQPTDAQGVVSRILSASAWRKPQG